MVACLTLITTLCVSSTIDPNLKMRKLKFGDEGLDQIPQLISNRTSI